MGKQTNMVDDLIRSMNAPGVSRAVGFGSGAAAKATQSFLAAAGKSSRGPGPAGSLCAMPK